MMRRKKKKKIDEYENLNRWLLWLTMNYSRVLTFVCYEEIY